MHERSNQRSAISLYSVSRCHNIEKVLDFSRIWIIASFLSTVMTHGPKEKEKKIKKKKGVILQ
jgi:hypothetical protein